MVFSRLLAASLRSVSHYIFYSRPMVFWLASTTSRIICKNPGETDCLLLWSYLWTYDRYPIERILFLILWVFVLTFRLKVGNAASRYLGSISYDVFLYHGLVQRLLQVLDKTSCRVNLSSGIFLLLMMIFSILLSAGTHIVNVRILALLKRKWITEWYCVKNGSNP